MHRFFRHLDIGVDRPGGGFGGGGGGGYLGMALWSGEGGRAACIPQTAMILALDLGTTTGWALQAGSSILCDSESFKPSRFSGGGMRYLKFRRFLEGHPGLTEVYFEEVRRHAGTDAAHAYGGFLAILMAWCEDRGIPYHGVPVGTIKKFATGKGNADKITMINAARALGFSPPDDNAADALHLMRYVLSMKGIQR